ncbi:hypothetical protein PPL_01470 [Heterostelium album PN500]|uniref:F-box domain-containing protein n=1 Tax=Heterostelium pallidum (strain ATCC 26659 / Pp 5 / PN500) TaxID=670386 RepID=D3AZD0_HETP5|nr:hypothetical protein PPL_01470 [Heterostelium album PN500]EFA85513.1 hypothetical protein PPL_01470 [Heterostelium album PN500]|eukprot:XP_020437621.1 hypothetical protein PPL_01470 [Heterostelium album PN500]
MISLFKNFKKINKSTSTSPLIYLNGNKNYNFRDNLLTGSQLNHEIFNIPLEVLSSILLFLEPRELINLSESCKLFNFYLNNSWIWNQLLEKSLPIQNDSIVGIEWLNNNTSIVKSLLFLHSKRNRNLDDSVEKDSRIVNLIFKTITERRSNFKLVEGLLTILNNFFQSNPNTTISISTIMDLISFYNSNLELLKLSFNIFNNLIKGNNENYNIIVDNLKILIRVVSENIGDAELHYNSILLISKIIEDKEAINTFGSNGGLSLVLKIAQSHKENKFFQSMFTFILYKTIISYNIKFKENYIVVNLIQILKRFNLENTILMNGLLTLVFLSNSRFFIQTFKKQGIISFTLSSIQIHFDNPRIVEYCLKILTNMTYNCAKCCKKVLKEDGLPILLQTMKIDHQNIRFFSNKTIFNTLYYSKTKII